MKANLIKIVIVVFLVIAHFTYMYHPGPAPKKFIESQGYTNVEMGTLTILGCRAETGYSFKAKKDNIEVSGAVCNSFIVFGNNVIRLK